MSDARRSEIPRGTFHGTPSGEEIGTPSSPYLDLAEGVEITPPPLPQEILARQAFSIPPAEPTQGPAGAVATDGEPVEPSPQAIHPAAQFETQVEAREEAETGPLDPTTEPWQPELEVSVEAPEAAPAAEPEHPQPSAEAAADTSEPLEQVPPDTAAAPDFMPPAPPTVGADPGPSRGGGRAVWLAVAALAGVLVAIVVGAPQLGLRTPAWWPGVEGAPDERDAESTRSPASPASMQSGVVSPARVSGTSDNALDPPPVEASGAEPDVGRERSARSSRQAAADEPASEPRRARARREASGRPAEGRRRVVRDKQSAAARKTQRAAKSAAVGDEVAPRARREAAGRNTRRARGARAKNRAGGSASPGVALAETPSRKDIIEGVRAVEPALRACAAGRHGVAELELTIAGSGRVSHAVVQGAFGGTPEGSCMARAVRKAKFPPFTQSPFEVLYPLAL